MDMVHMEAVEEDKTLCGLSMGQWKTNDPNLVTCHRCQRLVQYGTTVTKLAIQVGELARDFKVDPKEVMKDVEYARITMARLAAEIDRKAN